MKWVVLGLIGIVILSGCSISTADIDCILKEERKICVYNNIIDECNDVPDDYVCNCTKSGDFEISRD